MRRGSWAPSLVTSLAFGVSTVIGLGVVCLADGSPAVAQAAIDTASCDLATYDPAGQLVEGALLPGAVARLTTLGALVRVRVEAGLGADIDGHVARLEAACSSWRTDGRRAPNLLVVAVLPDVRRTAVYYGASYAPALDGRWTDIETNVMNPAFRLGDVAGGLAAGLGSIADAIGPRQVADRVVSPAVARPSGGVGAPIIGLALLLAALAVRAFIRIVWPRDWSQSDAARGSKWWGFASRSGDDGASGDSSWGDSSSGGEDGGGSGGGGSTSW